MSPLQGNFYNQIPTQLNINGPELYFVDQPDNITVEHEDEASFVGVASLRYTDGIERVTDLSGITYQWYEVGVGPVPDGIGIGATSTFLRFPSVTSPTDNGRRFYLETQYNPLGYGVSFYTDYVEIGITTNNINGTLVGIGTTVSYAGDALNEPLRSDIVTLTVTPYITITEHPQAVITSPNTDVTFFVDATTSDNSDSQLSYQWRRSNSSGENVNLSNSSTVSGATSDTLTIRDSNLGGSNISCLVSHPTARPSAVISNTALYSVVPARDILRFESFYETSTSSTATLSESILTASGISSSFSTDPSNPLNLISFYAPEKDVLVKMTIAGAAGASKGSFTGGPGGVSVIEFIATKNTEYVLRIGSATTPVGSTGGGGGGTFLYRKGTLIAAVGGGGGAGTNANGGAGGGVNNAGSSGGGSNGGNGGAQVSVGSLGTNIIDPSGSTGGKVASCAPGTYYSSIGVAACSDVGNNVRFVNLTGTTVSNTAFINRGFKAGTSGRNNGGSGSTTEGGGGSGARGGNAGTGGGSAGGGGSGYNDGSITIRTAQAAGNTSTNGYVQIQLGSANPPGFSSNGIYLDLTELPSTNISLNISTSEESGIFHYVNIPGIDNIPENAGSRNYTVQGGRVYGPCSAPNGNLYIGNETPIGGIRTLVVEEGGDDWNDMILSVSQGFFRRITAQ
jgi:hypothetical protein